jgi:hypothetical protein
MIDSEIDARYYKSVQDKISLLILIFSDTLFKTCLGAKFKGPNSMSYAKLARHGAKNVFNEYMDLKAGK